MSKEWISQHGTDVSIEVVIQPSSSRSEIKDLESWRGKIKISLISRPINGAANSELINLISKKLSIPKNRIILSKGLTNRRKTIKIKNIQSEYVKNIFGCG
ncbi:MAG: DUF167 domain-containing protein [Candidatus Poseidoniales archaeon]|jgi:uncharacterized protein (TIGR00251 family)|tara:strand:- start:2296 stop:2598 length:303 start_codon:yes stop_codon:yes gene_type:complete